MRDAILVVNSGSSSIKFAVYCLSDKRLPACQLRGLLENIGGDSRFHVTELTRGQETTGTPDAVDTPDHASALSVILDWLSGRLSDLTLVAAGHRIVHGGRDFTDAIVVDADVLDKLYRLVPLAPLHQPHALRAIEALQAQQPDMSHVACFDTAFHASMTGYERRFALPRELREEGICRYGFHGLSYEYITSVLPEHLGKSADGKVVIAHLGHGASMCALKNRHSVATTMSFTPLDGLPMGRRSGSVDPAVVLYLLQGGRSVDEISDILHHQSGLLGISGISDDMQTLLRSTQAEAGEAVGYFCYHVSRELASLAAALQGLEALVFTGGIGEHAAPVRQRICEASAWLGIAIDQEANDRHSVDIGAAHSQVALRVIPTDEEYIIAKHTFSRIGMT